MASQTVVKRRRGPGCFLRMVYFIFVGIWFSSIWAALAWVLCLTILGLPLGLWMLNRMPEVVTLQLEREDLFIDADGRLHAKDIKQLPFVLRAIYFVLIGWWFSALWLSVAWFLSASIIGLPFAFWMFNRVPLVVTLGRT
ncbi:MAG: YccF domain-containing protein [Chloroflexaceae bacterium]|nr:YccF domain-containing protein [Chloroflexaceae bacterium]